MEQLMPKNMSLQTRIITAFLLVGAIVLIVALIGWSGNARLSSRLNTFANNAMPSIDSLWKVNEAQARVRSGERGLIIPALTADQRQKELSNILNAFKDIDEGFSQYQFVFCVLFVVFFFFFVLFVFVLLFVAHEEFIRLHDHFQKTDLGSARQAQVVLMMQANTF